MSVSTILDADLRAKTAHLFDVAKIRPEKRDEVDALSTRIIKGKATYKQIEQLTGVVWWMVGLLHARESTCNFKRHLHNGDPLTARTVQVPKGRPKFGKAPFTFIQSAEDALQLDGLVGFKDVTVANVLFTLENFNGRGYRNRGIPSPYVWAGTDQYIKGKYVADSVFDPDHVDQQIGIAALMIRMYERGAISLLGEPISVNMNGKATDIAGYILRGNTFVGARGLAEACGATVATASVEPFKIVVDNGPDDTVFPAHLFDTRGYIDASDLAEFLKRDISYLGSKKTLAITKHIAKSNTN